MTIVDDAGGIRKAAEPRRLIRDKGATDGQHDSIKVGAVELAALKFATRGVHVFPVDGKIPAATGGRGVHDASADYNQIRQWWSRYPSANVAIAAGASGLVVVDVDCKHGVDGAATMRRLQPQLGPLPETLTARTPSGGWHLYFRAPDEELRPSVGKVGDMDAPGVDIRAGASYVVSPPSSIDGRRYRWLRRMAPAELPARWLEALRPPPPTPPPAPTRLRGSDRSDAYARAALEGEVAELAATPRGQRNHALNATAFRLGTLVGAGALDASTVRDALRWVCAAKWRSRTRRKDAATIERGLRAGMSHPRELEVCHAA